MHILQGGIIPPLCREEEDSQFFALLTSAVCGTRQLGGGSVSMSAQ